jgi:hypothetical protein
LLESFSNFVDLIHHVSIVDDVDNSMCMSPSSFDSIGLFFNVLELDLNNEFDNNNNLVDDDNVK